MAIRWFPSLDTRWPESLDEIFATSMPIFRTTEILIKIESCSWRTCRSILIAATTPRIFALLAVSE